MSDIFYSSQNMSALAESIKQLENGQTIETNLDELDKICSPKFSVIIPCYNEIETLPSLIARIMPMQKKYGIEFVLAENGSSDGSAEYFKTKIEGRYKDIKTVYIKQNRGYGYGIQQGIKAASGEYIGWIHADMQIPPEALVPFFDTALQNKDNRPLFLKGRRHGRGLIDNFFTAGQSTLSTILFRAKISDIGAIPVLASRCIFDGEDIDKFPNDFSLELYVYLLAIRKKAAICRFPVMLGQRKKGKSSWDGGIKAKLRQAKLIFSDTMKILKGEKVL